ncbi:MAG: UDP-N-acetylmuramoylalanine--D-glutamate ligase MurD [Bacteroidetes bacterium HLUCCA01]|nr:MAG: UDP-N-acetylmuramoylalanine--D-glutamate ligase MurD [Bacteroidetes bacterium HLUCCA01]
MLQKNQHIVVIGAARSGVAAARLLNRNGYRILLSDSGDINPSFRQLLEQDQIEFEQHGHSERAWNADCMVVSPGVPDTAPIVSNFLTKGKPVFSEVEAASWFCAAPMAAVTGSNGKTTVVTWLDHLWKTADKPHQTGGNIGKAFSDVAGLCTTDHWALLEVSSFQLDHIHRFQPGISCILNITPDHLDRYEYAFENYVSSKMRILENQTSDDLFVYWQDDVHVTARLNTMVNGPRRWSFSASGPVNQGLFVDNGVLTWSFDDRKEPLMPASDIRLNGQHNLLNAMAVALIGRAAGIPDEAIRSALGSFTGVEHRLERVGQINGAVYINDSKATNVESVRYALTAVENPVILIMGGLDKGNDYSQLSDVVKQKVRALIAIGKATPLLRDQFAGIVPEFFAENSLQDAVHRAHSLAEAGTTVLLSPACASFDMFENYEHRGRVFKAAVNALQEAS